MNAKIVRLFSIFSYMLTTQLLSGADTEGMKILEEVSKVSHKNKLRLPCTLQNLILIITIFCSKCQNVILEKLKYLPWFLKNLKEF